MNIIYRLLLVFVFLFYFSFIAYCKNLNVSFINNKDNSNISLELNSVLQLEGLILKETNVSSQLILPFYEGKNNRYPYFSFLDTNFKNYVIDAIKTNNIIKTHDTIINYKINKFHIVDDSQKVKAFVSVIFNDLLEVQCSIMNGKYGLWVQWPSKKQNNKWQKLFIIKDKKLKDKIDSEFLKLYKEKVIQKNK